MYTYTSIITNTPFYSTDISVLDRSLYVSKNSLSNRHTNK